MMSSVLSNEPPRIAKAALAALVRESVLRRDQKKQKAEKAAQARENLLDFIQYCKPDYLVDPFHVAVCKIFEQFLQDVLADKRPRVMLTAPPQHGKSEIVSRNFPVWAQGKHPLLRFLCASYGATWAEDLSGDRLRILNSEAFHEVFPEYRLIRKRADYLQNQRGGFMLAAGVDCGITGRSSDIGLIDDPIKGYKDAVSDSVRTGILNWYRTEFYSRLQMGAGVIIMMTRWHEDDLIGRLIDEMRNGGEDWQIYNFPAIAAEGDSLGRSAGAPLAPQRFDTRSLESIKKVQGSYAWNALYQGQPAPAEGLMLKRDYWRYYGEGELPEFDLIVVSLDAAFKSTADSDHVALHAWGFIGARGYLLDRVCERMGYTATKEATKHMALKWHAHGLLIEDKANGSAVIEELSRTIGSGVSIIPIDPAGGKIARAWPFSADLEAGNAWLPEHLAWGGDIVEYAAKFPTSPMDHDIDAMTQAFNWRRENMHGLFEYLKKQAEASKMQDPKKNSLAKIETAEETPRCPQCGAITVRQLDGMGHMHCNQCGHEYLRPNALTDQLAPQMCRRLN